MRTTHTFDTPNRLNAAAIDQYLLDGLAELWATEGYVRSALETSQESHANGIATLLARVNKKIDDMESLLAMLDHSSEPIAA